MTPSFSRETMRIASCTEKAWRAESEVEEVEGDEGLVHAHEDRAVGRRLALHQRVVDPRRPSCRGTRTGETARRAW